jgi:hypothetical protein
MAAQHHASPRTRLIGWLLALAALVSLHGQAFAHWLPAQSGAGAFCSAADASRDRSDPGAPAPHQGMACALCSLSTFDAPLPAATALRVIGPAPGRDSTQTWATSPPRSHADWPQARPRAPPGSTLV